MKKDKFYLIFVIILILLIVIGSFMTGFSLNRSKKSYDFKNVIIIPESENPKYQFLEPEISDYICAICDGLNVDCVVINFTIRALKHNGGCPKSDINIENFEYIKRGFINLKTHIANVLKYTKNIVVCLNRFDTDTVNEISCVKDLLKELGVNLKISSSYMEGSKGSIDLAKEVIRICNNTSDFKFLYDLNDSIENKISSIVKEIYRCDIEFTENAKNTINKLNDL